MAGDWIKMRNNLGDDPAVVFIAAELHLDQDTIVGKLHRLWGWASEHTIDGRAESITLSFVDAFVKCPNFAEKMCAIGWLKVTKTGLSFPHFDRHLSESAKKRAINAIHQAQKRVREMSEKTSDKIGTPSFAASSSFSSSNSSSNSLGGAGGEIDPGFTGKYISLTQADVKRLHTGSKTNPPLSDEEITYWLGELNYARSHTKRWPYTDLTLTIWNWRSRALGDGKDWNPEKHRYEKRPEFSRKSRVNFLPTDGATI